MPERAGVLMHFNEQGDCTNIEVHNVILTTTTMPQIAHLIARWSAAIRGWNWEHRA